MTLGEQIWHIAVSESRGEYVPLRAAVIREINQAFADIEADHKAEIEAMDEDREVSATPAEYALEHAIIWWEATKAMDLANNNAGVAFPEDYEPAWVQEARLALPPRR
jgi:hypothetical protein